MRWVWAMFSRKPSRGACSLTTERITQPRVGGPLPPPSRRARRRTRGRVTETQDAGAWKTITSAGIDQPEPITVSGYEGGNPAAARDLIESIERARVFSKREHAIDEEIEIGLRGNQISIQASCDGGRFEEVVRALDPVTGKFLIHPDFLVAALAGGESPSCILNESKIKFVGPQWQHVIALR